ncbi:hypothetical protein B0T21DRAFT_381291 [Apiosordaria backusii]|uniref:Uncharacterized protein n=1 Tax=Apiosordaria backusii TaxID=314023 RepID=A0AA40ETK2_9PEZI|nr:hypothetical protein B0T21DRAFT_381291 [Apiosordaria backusii]
MYGQFVHWRQTLIQDAEDKDNRDEGRAPRQDNDQHHDEEEQEEAEFASRIAEWRKQRAQPQHRDHQHNGQRHRKQSEKSRQPPPSSPQPTDSPSPEPSSENASPPGRSAVDKLARKLSKQNLQHNNRVHAKPSGQLTPSPLHSMPPVVPEAPAIVPETSTTCHALSEYLEVDPQHQQPTSSGPSCSDDAPQLPATSLAAGFEKPEDKRLEFKRLRQRASARALEARLQEMIDDQTRCNVRSKPLLPPATATTARPWLTQPPVSEPVFIEVDPDYAMPNWDDTLEADENDTGDMSMIEDLTTSARHAHAPSGVRKNSIGGVALRYRLSVDAALRCQNVVRSRPRMRKRDKSRHGSTVSSAMTSAISSPVIAPTIPSSSSMPPPPPSTQS